MEDHDYLFFNCSYFLKIWKKTQAMTGLENYPSRWCNIVHIMSNNPNGKYVWSVVGRLMFAACEYCVWRERNARILTDKRKRWEEVYCNVVDVVKIR